jgi:hypothetical protein
MGLHELPPPAVALVYAALPWRDRRALRAASRDMRAVANACVTCVKVGGGMRGVPVAELPRLAERFPRVRELQFQPARDGDFTPFGDMVPELEALPPACCPSVERAGGPPLFGQHLNPLAVVQLARLCPGLTRVAFGAMTSVGPAPEEEEEEITGVPEDCGYIGPALEALAAGCRGLASLDLHIGISLDHIFTVGIEAVASVEAVAAAAAGLRRLGGGLRELGVVFASARSRRAAPRRARCCPP